MLRVGVIALVWFSGRCGPGLKSLPLPEVTLRSPVEVVLEPGADSVRTVWTIADVDGELADFDLDSLDVVVSADAPEHLVELHVTNCFSQDWVEPVQVTVAGGAESGARSLFPDDWRYARREALCVDITRIEGEAPVRIGGSVTGRSASGESLLIESESAGG